MLSVYRFGLVVCSPEGNGDSAEVRDVSDDSLLILIYIHIYKIKIKVNQV